MANDDREEFAIKIFRDDPIWDRHSKWFTVPMHVLTSLYIGTVIRKGYGPTTEGSSVVQQIRREHPGCVLVY